jgi:hypothetical protein
MADAPSLTSFQKFTASAASVAKTVDPLWGAAGLVQIATAKNKMRELVNVAKEFALMPIVWPASLLGALAGVKGMIKGLVVETGSLAAAFERMAKVRAMVDMFTPLMRNAAAARTRIVELYDVTRKSPFNVDQWAAASKQLEILTKGAMGGGKSLDFIGNAALTAGVGVDQMAEVFGEAVKEIKEGVDVKAATAGLQQMGLVTYDVADSLKRLQDTGAGSEELIGKLSTTVATNSGSMKRWADSAEGVAKRQADAWNDLKVAVGKPWTGKETAIAKNMLAIIQNLTPAIVAISEAFSYFTGGLSVAFSWLGKMLSSIPGLATIVKILTLAVLGMAHAFALKWMVEAVQGIGMIGGALKNLIALCADTINWVGKMVVKLAAAVVEARALSMLQKGSTMRGGGVVGGAASAEAEAAGGALMAKGAELLAKSEAMKKAGFAIQNVIKSIWASFTGFLEAIGVGLGEFFAIFVVLAALAVGIKSLYDRTKKLKEENEAYIGLRDKLHKDLEAAHDLETGLKAISAAEDEYAKSKEKTRGLERREAGKSQFRKNFEEFFFPVIHKELEQSRKQTAGYLKEVEHGKKMFAEGRFGVSQKEQDIMLAMERRKLAMRQIGYERDVSRHRETNEVDLMAKEEARHANFAKQGDETLAKELEYEDMRRHRAKQLHEGETRLTVEQKRERKKAEEELANFRRTRGSDLMKREQALRDLEAKGKGFTPEAIAERKRLQVLREETVTNREQHAEEAERMRAAIEQKRKDQFDYKTELDRDIKQKEAFRAGRAKEGLELRDLGFAVKNFQDASSHGFSEADSLNMAMRKTKEDIIAAHGGPVVSELARIGGAAGAAAQQNLYDVNRQMLAVQKNMEKYLAGMHAATDEPDPVPNNYSNDHPNPNGPSAGSVGAAAPAPSKRGPVTIMGVTLG